MDTTLTLIQSLKNKTLRGEDITYPEALALSKEENLESLFNATNEIREKFMVIFKTWVFGWGSMEPLWGIT